jgi:hypothetical protein
MNASHITGIECGDTLLAHHNVLNLAAVRNAHGIDTIIIDGERLAIPARFVHATQQVICIAHLGVRKGRAAMKQLAANIKAAA